MNGTAKNGRDLLQGNGVGLVRERALACRVQKGLERLYRIDEGPPVDAFMRAAGDGERESLLVHAAEDGTLELELRIPSLGSPHIDVDDSSSIDPLCQIIEGVSHFVYLAERARLDRETTQLEMEMQAEVDKYVVLAASVATSGELDVDTSERLRARLFDRVAYSQDAESALGERYRIANDAAKRFTRKLQREYVEPKRFHAMRRELRDFYRLGQEDKLRFVRAAV